MKLKKYYSQEGDDLSSKLKSYSALTGAFLFSAGQVQSQIVFTDINPDTLINNSIYDIDLDNNGVVDYKIQQFTSYYWNRQAIFRQGADPKNRTMANLTLFYGIPWYYALNLQAGNPIGPGGPFWSFAFVGHAIGLGRHVTQWMYTPGVPIDTVKWNGGFFPDDSGYIGVEFRNDGKKYYGWIEISMNKMVDGVVVKGFAYESTPNTYLLAGQGSVIGVPEQKSVTHASSIYPNPVRNGKAYINLDAKQNADLKIEIINGMGQLLQSENRKLDTGNNILEIDIKSLASGTYFVKVMEEESVFFRKIMISN